VQYLLLSIAQTMPLADPFDETEGVAPGKPKEPDVDVAEPGLNVPVDVLNG
jgi:hypothetical protein